MRMQILAVRDTAAEAYMRPMFVPTVGVGVRAFADEVARADSEMSKHPSDYILFHFGVWDDGTGVFELLAEPVQAARAVDYVEKSDEVPALLRRRAN